MWKKISQKFLGSPLNPLAAGARQSILLVAFFAWIGLGADGLSSANYGPEEAFRALHAYPDLSFYLMLAIVVSVFVIAAGYNQVIQLFPSGGGGYKVSSQLLGPIAGLVSGVALLIDYVLTIAISIAAAVDAILSLFPPTSFFWHLGLKLLLIAGLLLLNLRGMKESIKFLMPIFLGFVITHVVVLAAGFFMHEHQLPIIWAGMQHQQAYAVHHIGTLATAALLMKAYSLGAGTFTGLEAVSNNVNMLKEPRVRTGQWTMFYMALSLSLMAGGILLMYMLWNVTPQPGKTYNAVLFANILGGHVWTHAAVSILMIFEAGILMLGANTGFLGGPAVLANMALDRWVPLQFGNLSNRLVKQNGIITLAAIAAVVMLLTRGHVSILVVLYSITVFLTFLLSLFGLVKYWFQNRKIYPWFTWTRQALVAGFGCIICVVVFVIICSEKFFEGGWMSLVILAVLFEVCRRVKRHYVSFKRKMGHYNKLLTAKPLPPVDHEPALQHKAPTAVVFLDSDRGVGVHTLLWVYKLFPDHFKNFVFIRVGVVDIESFSGEQELVEMRKTVNDDLEYFKHYAHTMGAASEVYAEFGTKPLEQYSSIADEITKQYSNCLFFASNLVFKRVSLMTMLCHNRQVVSLQNQLNHRGQKMLLLPMNVGM